MRINCVEQPHLHTSPSEAGRVDTGEDTTARPWEDTATMRFQGSISNLTASSRILNCLSPVATRRTCLWVRLCSVSGRKMKQTNHTHCQNSVYSVNWNQTGSVSASSNIMMPIQLIHIMIPSLKIFVFTRLTAWTKYYVLW